MSRWVTRRDQNWGQEKQGFKSFLKTEARTLEERYLLVSKLGVSNRRFLPVWKGGATQLARNEVSASQKTSSRLHVITVALGPLET